MQIFLLIQFWVSKGSSNRQSVWGKFGLVQPDTLTSGAVITQMIPQHRLRVCKHTLMRGWADSVWHGWIRKEKQPRVNEEVFVLPTSQNRNVKRAEVCISLNSQPQRCSTRGVLILGAHSWGFYSFLHTWSKDFQCIKPLSLEYTNILWNQHKSVFFFLVSIYTLHQRKNELLFQPS